jgi:hypothetical protein
MKERTEGKYLAIKSARIAKSLVALLVNLSAPYLDGNHRNHSIK